MEISLKLKSEKFKKSIKKNEPFLTRFLLIDLKKYVRRVNRNK